MHVNYCGTICLVHVCSAYDLCTVMIACGSYCGKCSIATAVRVHHNLLMKVMCELLSHKRALRRPAVVAAVSNETPALVAAIHTAATSAADRAIDHSSRGSRTVDKSSSGGEVERLASALTRVKQAALRVETAEKAVAVFASSQADQAVADAVEGIQGLCTQLKELEQVCSRVIRA